MTADTRVTYNPATHRLEWGGPDDRTFLTVTRPFWLSQEVMDQVLQPLVEAVQERDRLIAFVRTYLQALEAPGAYPEDQHAALGSLENEAIALRDLHEGRV